MACNRWYGAIAINYENGEYLISPTRCTRISSRDRRRFSKSSTPRTIIAYGAARRQTAADVRASGGAGCCLQPENVAYLFWRGAWRLHRHQTRRGFSTFAARRHRAARWTAFCGEHQTARIIEEEAAENNLKQRKPGVAAKGYQAANKRAATGGDIVVWRNKRRRMVKVTMAEMARRHQ